MDPSQTLTFDRLLATAPRDELDTYPALSFSNVRLKMTPEIERGAEKRWPQDERSPIVASYRGPDRLKYFLLEVPEQVERQLAVLAQPFWIDAWSQHWQRYASHWSWRPPFYHRGRSIVDPDHPWFHWLFVAKVQSPGLLITVESPRTARIDDDSTIEMPTGCGFFMTKEGPPGVG